MKTLVEKKAEVKRLSSWFRQTIVDVTPNPDVTKSVTKKYIYLCLLLTQCDPDADLAIYQGLMFTKKPAIDPGEWDDPFVATTGVHYNVDLCHAVATRQDNGLMDLRLNHHSQRSYSIPENQYFNATGTVKWFDNINMTPEDITMKPEFERTRTYTYMLQRLRKSPIPFENLDFKTEYNRRYLELYPIPIEPVGDNSNDDLTKIDIKTIATETSPGSNLYNMNADVTITSDQYLGIDADYFVITRYSFTNNGTFNNAGTFCTSKNFTNNGTFDNSNTGFTLNLFGGIFTNTKNVFNRGNGNIINFGTYNGRGGVVIGKQIQSLNPELSQFFKNQLP